MNCISTFDITKYPLLDILKDIKTGWIQLPDFQRDWVWDDSRIRRLISCISLGYPIGSVMLLQQPNTETHFKSRPVEGVILTEAKTPHRLILDGQQRLTTLFQVLLSNQVVRIQESNNTKLVEKWYYIDIEKSLEPHRERRSTIIALPDSKKGRLSTGEMIDCSTPENEYKTGYFPLSQIFSFSEWRNEYSRFWQYNLQRLNLIDAFEAQVIKKFEHYHISTTVLRDFLPKEAVCQVFEETNTSGCELNYFDLMSSSYCANGYSLREDWNLKASRLKSFNILRLLRNTDFLQAVTLVAAYHRRQNAILHGKNPDKLPGVGCRRVDVLRLSPEDYQSWSEAVTKGFEESARFLHSHKFFDGRDIAYPIQLVALASIFTVLGQNSRSERVRSCLSRWFWCGLFGEIYTSRHENQAGKDIIEVMEWLSGGCIPSTISDATFSKERLWRARKRYGAIHQGLAALLRTQGSLDFRTGEEINDVIYFEEQIDSHHIFPVLWSRQQRLDPQKYNCLVNRTPLSAKTNQKIGGKAPSIYLRELEESGIPPGRLDEILRSHAIDPYLLRRDDFEGFLMTRTQVLMELIGNAMGCRLEYDPLEHLPKAYKNSRRHLIRMAN